MHYTPNRKTLMEGAVCAIRERLDEWVGELSKTEPVITFCVYGFHIGCETAVNAAKGRLRFSLYDGGHYAWKAMKGPCAVKLLPSRQPEALSFHVTCGFLSTRNLATVTTRRVGGDVLKSRARPHHPLTT